MLAVLGTVVSIVVLLAGTVLTVSRATAVWERVTETGKPGLLVLDIHDETSVFSTLDPGESTQWLVAASLVQESRGSLAIELSGEGELVDLGGLVASIEGCEEGFVVTEDTVECVHGAETLLPETPLSELTGNGTKFPLREILQGEPREMLVTFTLPEEAQVDPESEDRSALGLGVHAAGDIPVIPPVKPPVTPPGGTRVPGSWPGSFAVTGTDGIALMFLAAGLIGTGACVAYWRRRAPVMNGPRRALPGRVDGGGERS